MRRLFLLFLWAIIPEVASSQFYSTGPDPLSVRWERLERPMWRIDSDSAARSWALFADHSLSQVATRLRADFPASLRLRPVDVVVHSRHAYSNGLVSWAPKRLEAYAFNRGADDCVPWASHLLTHEYRHVLQTQTSITGFSRALYVIFGQQSVGLVTGLFVPRWALEGDAVWAETRYTPGGRGRNALFLQQTRVLATSGLTPSFSQAYFGSYARRVPNFYHMGYHLVDAVSDSFGNAVFGNAIEAAGRKPFTFVPFQRSLRKQTAMRPMAAYRWAMGVDSLRWQKEMAWRHDTPSEPLWKPRSDYEEVLSTRPWSGGHVAYVSSPSYVAYFSVRDAKGHEIRRITPSARNGEAFDVHADTIVWSERRQHCRWANASENCVMMADLRTGRSWRFTRGHDYHSPTFSPDGRRLAAVLSLPDASHAVVLLDGRSRRVVRRFPAGWHVPEVRWAADSALVAIVVSPEGKGVASIMTDGAAWWLLPSDFHDLRDISVLGPDVFFSMDSAGYADIYRLSRDTLTLVAQSRHGLRSPLPLSADSLVVSTYGPAGYQPIVVTRMEGRFCAALRRKAILTPADSLTDAGFSRLRAPRVHLLPNVHSWGPVVVDAHEQAISPGLSVASQNTHGTVSFQAGVNFWGDNDDERVFASATWDFLFPQLTFSGHWGHTDYDFVNTYKVKEVGKPDGVGEYIATVTVDDRVRHSDVTFGILLPLTRNSGLWSRGVTPYAKFRRKHTTGFECHIFKSPTNGGASIAYDDRTADSKFLCATFGLSAHLLRRTAERDVGPRGGLSLSALYDAAPWGADYGGQFFASARAYAPGFGLHHQSSLSVYAQHVRHGSIVTSAQGGYSYRLAVSNRQPSPYGLKRRDAQTSLLFRLAYHLPLLNPDWEVGPVAYFKRVNLRLIADYAYDRLWNGEYVFGSSNRYSASAELWAETRFFLLPYPVNTGFRLTYLPYSQSLSSAFLFSVSFN